MENILFDKISSISSVIGLLISLITFLYVSFISKKMRIVEKGVFFKLKNEDYIRKIKKCNKELNENILIFDTDNIRIKLKEIQAYLEILERITTSNECKKRIKEITKTIKSQCNATLIKDEDRDTISFPGPFVLETEIKQTHFEIHHFVVMFNEFLSKEIDHSQ